MNPKQTDPTLVGYEFDVGEVEPRLPIGWTYLIHGTSRDRGWEGVDLNGGEDIIVKSWSGLSVITQEDRNRTVQPDGSYDTTRSYAGKSNPMQIKIIFFSEELSSRRCASEVAQVVKDGLTVDQQTMIDEYYWRNGQHGRHPLIPDKTVLEQIGQGVDEKTGMPIYYYIPKMVVDDFARVFELSRT